MRDTWQHRRDISFVEVLATPEVYLVAECLLDSGLVTVNVPPTNLEKLKVIYREWMHDDAEVDTRTLMAYLDSKGVKAP